MSKSIQISKDLFVKLVYYFLFDDHEYHEDIKKSLDDKFDRVVKHELYSQYKDKDLTEQERENARKRYLDMVGMYEDFRW